MIAPKCRLCGDAHWPRAGCKAYQTAPVVHAKPVVHKPVAVVHKPVAVVHKRKAGVYLDPEARKAYRREWMRKRRKS